MQARLTQKAQNEMEQKWKLEHEAIEILKLVVSEWQSDPMSTQCFDLRIVNRATEIVKELGILTSW